MRRGDLEVWTRIVSAKRDTKVRIDPIDLSGTTAIPNLSNENPKEVEMEHDILQSELDAAENSSTTICAPGHGQGTEDARKEGDRHIVVLDRGWIFCGNLTRTDDGDNST